MEFSQYVIDEITKASQYEWHRNYDASRSLKNAAEKAIDTQDTRILNVLSGVLSMSYVHSEHTFCPYVVLADGHRSFAIEDIASDDFEILESVINMMQSSWICAHFAHVLWCLSKNNKYAEIAVPVYVGLFTQTLDPSEWVDCYDAIRVAEAIASKLGKFSDPYKKVYDTIKQALISIDGSDPLYLSLNLIKLIIKNASKQDLNSILTIANKLADKNIRQENEDFELAAESLAVQILVWNRLGMESEIKAGKAKLAEYYAKYAERLSASGDDFRAIELLKRACTLYAGIDQRRLFELRNRLEGLQKRSLLKMQTISVPVDTSGIIKRVDQLFSGLTMQEMILQIGRIVRIYKAEDVKKEVLEENGKSLLQSLFGSTLLNEKGQTVQELPPLDRKDPESDQELLFKHMVNRVSRERNYDEAVVLDIVFRQVQSIRTCTRDDLDFLVNENVIIPENRAETIKEGLFLGLTVSPYVAAHILLPQTENIFRNLVKMCGDPVTFLKTDGTEDIKPLSQLFKSEALRDCYSEDVIFTFQSIMDVPAGENLRNLIAHGQLELSIASERKCLHFLCLLIKLLSWYSVASQPILESLRERDEKCVSR